MSLNRRAFLEAAGVLSLSQGAWALEPENTGAMMPDDEVIELRQYTLRRGQRDVLISLFEQDFIEPQNGLGAHVLGIFRDLDDPDRFVWIRGFRDMAARQTALTTFYGGPVWLAKRTAANATMVDSDNVLLLRPAGAGLGFPARQPNVPIGEGVIGAVIHYVGRVDPTVFAQVFNHTVLPLLVSLGAHPIAQLVTETAPNNYPRLPIREGDKTFVWFARWPNSAAEEDFVRKCRGLSGWRDSVPEAVIPAFMQKPERLRLAPTARSLLR